MIGDDDRDIFGAGRLPEALQDPAPWHPAWGNEPVQNCCNFACQLS